jgi:hypothetical protein
VAASESVSYHLSWLNVFNILALHHLRILPGDLRRPVVNKPNPDPQAQKRRWWRRADAPQE